MTDIAHVYTTDRTDETLKNATRTTYVVTHDQITRNGYRTIGEALGGRPGCERVDLRTDWFDRELSAFAAAIPHRCSCSSTGCPRRVHFDNSVELGNLPTTGVDRIEVVEGGGSTLYGTGAIGGIINIITQRNSPNAATLAWGSFGEQRLEVDTDHVQISRVVAKNDYGLPNGSVRPDSDYASSAIHADGARRIGTFDIAVRAGLESDHLGTPGLFRFRITDLAPR